MSKCPQCGTDELEDIAGSDNAYCPECGEVVEPAEGDGEEAWCESCGDFRVADGDGCCARCGGMIEGAGRANGFDDFDSDEAADEDDDEEDY